MKYVGWLTQACQKPMADRDQLCLISSQTKSISVYPSIKNVLNRQLLRFQRALINKAICPAASSQLPYSVDNRRTSLMEVIILAINNSQDQLTFCQSLIAKDIACAYCTPESVRV